MTKQSKVPVDHPRYPTDILWWQCLAVVLLWGVNVGGWYFISGSFEFWPAVSLLPVYTGFWLALMLPLILLKPVWAETKSRESRVSAVLVDGLIMVVVLFYWGSVSHLANLTGLFAPHHCMQLVSLGWVYEPMWLFYAHLGVIFGCPLVYASTKLLSRWRRSRCDSSIMIARRNQEGVVDLFAQ